MYGLSFLVSASSVPFSSPDCSVQEQRHLAASAFSGTEASALRYIESMNLALSRCLSYPHTDGEPAPEQGSQPECL